MAQTLIILFEYADGINRRIETHDSADSDELKYWNKNVVPYYTEPIKIFGQEMQISPMFPEKLIWKPTEELFITIIKILVNKTFGKTESKRKLWKRGYKSAMNVLWCSSGCNGNWVQVGFHHDGCWRASIRLW